ncbi:MAG TPA: alpha/beta hydrolase [Phenylobacterium sp.]|nr:alpha/beta hydrolase [Phenylobacterium sp.]
MTHARLALPRRQLIAGALAASLAAPAFARPASDAQADAAAARRFDRERRFLPTAFGRIAYVERGRGPVALFLHGFPLSGFQWRGALDRLSGVRRCLAPDFLGLGHTEPAHGQSVAPAAQVEMLAAFLDHLGVRRVDLVANDSGGAVAQLFAARWPERVRSLLLTNCDVETDSPPAALLPVLEMAREGTYPDRWLVPWLRDKALARSAEGLGGMCFSDPSRPTDVALEQYLGPLVASPARKALTNRYALGLSPNPLAGLSPRLCRVTAPVRVLWGMSDTIFNPENPEYLRRVFPNVDGVLGIAAARLFFPEEFPDIVAAEARRLWAKAGHG